MGIFSRMGDIINSNVSALLDKAENPQKIARLMIREMEDTLVEVRTSAARYLAEQKQLKRYQDENKEQIKDWREKARLALEKKRDDLAKGALAAKQRAEKRFEALSLEYERIAHAIDQANQDMIRLQKKLEEAKAKYQALRVRYHTANDRVKLRKMTADNRVENALSRYAQVEKHIDSLEAEAEVHDLGYRTLESHFVDLEQEKEVEEELQSLKTEIKKNKEKTGTS